MKRKTPYLVAILVLAVALGAWRLRRPDATVEVIHPRVGDLRAYVEEQATTRLPRDYLIAMPIPGWLQPIELREGDAVKQGQIVARLDVEDLRDHVRQVEQRIAVLETNIKETLDNRLEDNALVHTLAMVKSFDETVKSSEAKVEAAKAVAEFAHSEVERIRKLEQANAAPSREMREAEMQWRKANAEQQSNALEHAALKTLQAVSYIGPKFIKDYVDRKSFTRQSYEQQLAEARAQLEIEKRNLARAELASPIDGVVLERHQTRRQYLQAGTPLLTLGRLEDLEVIAEVLTERVTRIAPDNAVDVFGEAIGANPIVGRVTRIYPAGFKKISSLGVEQQRVNVAIKLDPRPPRLGVEFRVNVRIYYDDAKSALILPRVALFRGEQGEWQVLVVRDGVTYLQAVKLGLTNDDDAQIAAGLTAADEVVARPSQDLVAGMRVETRKR